MAQVARTISFFSQGCRLNHSESALIERSFETQGFQIVGFKEPADIVVINNVACIPDGTERRFLSELFANKATLYNQAQPATLTFSLILKNQYPCN